MMTVSVKAVFRFAIDGLVFVHRKGEMAEIFFSTLDKARKFVSDIQNSEAGIQKYMEVELSDQSPPTCLLTAERLKEDVFTFLMGRWQGNSEIHRPGFTVAFKISKKLLENERSREQSSIPSSLSRAKAQRKPLSLEIEESPTPSIQVDAILASPHEAHHEIFFV